MKAKYSYFRVKYGRYSGAKTVIRYCRVDQLGKISFVEKRTNTSKKENPADVNMYKIGNTTGVTYSLNQILPSTKSEWSKMIKEALYNLL